MFKTNTRTVRGVKELGTNLILQFVQYSDMVWLRNVMFYLFEAHNFSLSWPAGLGLGHRMGLLGKEER